MALQIKRGFEQAWTDQNPYLEEGQLGWDMTNNLFKIGGPDRIRWNDITESFSPTDAGGLVALALRVTEIEESAQIIVVTDVLQQMAVNRRYMANNIARVDFTLPAVAAVGKWFYVASNGTGGWRISQNAGQQIILQEGGTSDDQTTVGVPGYLESTEVYNAILLECRVANTIFMPVSVYGAPQPF